MLQIPGFEIERTLGKGGMATVYLATQESLGRKVALKTVVVSEEGGDPSLAATANVHDTRSVERLIEEGRMIASLTHPNIVSVFDIGATNDLLFITMEYLKGGDLSARIGTGMPAKAVFAVALAIASALEFSHANGVIHRDIKPANILFREDDIAVLSDFGVAKQVSKDVGLTQTGLVLGSPSYMSPEQIQGERLDAGSDIYNLGVVLYEMLTAHLPFQGDDPYKLMMEHLHRPVPELPLRLSEVQPLLNGMLTKKTRERFSIEQVLTELARLQALETFAADETPAVVAIGVVACAPVIEKLRQGVIEDLAADRVVLPSLPEVAIKVRDVVSRPNVTAREIAQIVATDPALSARLLRVANSAIYGGAKPARDLSQTVVRLGHKMVLHLVNLLVVAQLYDAQSHRLIRSHVKDLWRHSTLVATLSERFAKDIRRLEPEVAMLSGLIHDIGKLPILAWAEKIPHVLSDPGLLTTIMDQLHVEMGGRIVEDWQYSPELIEVVAGHEEIHREHEGGPDYVDVVLAANLIGRIGDTDELSSMWGEVSAFSRLGLTREKASMQLIEVDATVDDLSETLLA